MGCCGINVRIAIAAIGVACGFCAPIFAFRFYNFNAAALCLVSGLFAVATLVLHVLYKKHRLEHAFRPYLRTIMLIGCFGQLIGSCALVAYLTLGGVLGQKVNDIYGENYWVAAVWGWMTWKWGFQLFWFSRMYLREFERDALLPNSDKAGLYVANYDSESGQKVF